MIDPLDAEHAWCVMELLVLKREGQRKRRSAMSVKHGNDMFSFVAIHPLKYELPQAIIDLAMVELNMEEEFWGFNEVQAADASEVKWEDA